MKKEDSMAEKKVEGYAVVPKKSRKCLLNFWFDEDEAKEDAEENGFDYRPVALQFLDEAQPPSASEMLEALNVMANELIEKTGKENRFFQGYWQAIADAEQWLQKRGGR